MKLDPVVYQRHGVTSLQGPARLLLDDRGDAPQGIGGSLVQLVVLHEP